jgi:hypothetical protein
MNPIKIPIATAGGKSLIIAACALVVVGVLSWGAPKFRVFLNVVLGKAPRKPGTKNIHLVFGFFVYLIIFAPVVIATFIGVGVATARPTVISDEGVSGGDLVCDSELRFSLLPLLCTSPLTPNAASPVIVKWEEIDRVNCIVRRNGTVREVEITSGRRRIHIGSMVVYDLGAVHQFIVDHSPKSAAHACFVPLGRNQ